jgi:hypothetical protein
VPYYPLDPSLLVITYAISPDLIRDLQPAYIITLEVYVRRTLLPAPWFQAEYTLLQELESDIYGSDGMLIFERVPRPLLVLRPPPGHHGSLVDSRPSAVGEMGSDNRKKTW